MEIDTWVAGYKVRAFPWIDGKRIYFNVQYFRPGQSLERPPAFDKSVYITANDAGMNLLHNYLDSLTEHVAGMRLKPETEITLTA